MEALELHGQPNVEQCNNNINNKQITYIAAQNENRNSVAQVIAERQDGMACEMLASLQVQLLLVTSLP